MATTKIPRSQYNHYISQFILKEFKHGRRKDRTGVFQDTIHVFDIATGQFCLKDVKRACGDQDLYYDALDANPMRIELLFSKLESKMALLFRKIKDAVAQGIDHIDIREEDVRRLFRFMQLSRLRSKKYKEDVISPHRENAFLLQSLFEAARARGKSGDPKQFWLDQLIYLLETDHEQILADAECPDDNPFAYTYKRLTERFALQIWKAAAGYEFFLNESLVDFEGDTESRLGVEKIDDRLQLIEMTNEDLIHMILPISPQIAVVFCDESRCWESPFAEALLRAKIPYPDNSYLKNAPHKDIVAVDVPETRTRKKMWPATTAWRVSIGLLRPEHHRVITSYSLSHAKDLIVIQNRRRFERAKKDLDVFSQRQVEKWKARGDRFRYPDQRSPVDDTPFTEKRLERLADRKISALDKIIEIATVTHEVPPFSKETAFTFWEGMQMFEKVILGKRPSKSPDTGDQRLPIRIMHPALRLAFEAAYPPKDPSHRDLNVDLAQFIITGLGEETFRQLCQDIDMKTVELVSADAFLAQWEIAQSEISHSYESLDVSDTGEDGDYDKSMVDNPEFKEIYRIAQTVDALVWMFEERQDILATFIAHGAVPIKETQPRVTRLRGRRE